MSVPFFGTIPFVILAESLPGTAGLGEREAALILFPGLGGPMTYQQARLLCFGLTWSSVVILGRLAIGLVSRWLPHRVACARRTGMSTAKPTPKTSGHAIGR